MRHSVLALAVGIIVAISMVGCSGGGNPAAIGSDMGGNDGVVDTAFANKTPTVRLTKDVDVSEVGWGGEVTYTYTLQATGNGTAYDVTIMDDNGTPDDETDDFLVGFVDILKPGDVREFTVTKILTPMCGLIGDEPGTPGSLVVEELPNGDIKIVYTQSRKIVDNTYGANAVGYAKEATFKSRLGSDKAEFSVTNGDGAEALHFTVDYISASGAYPSGYGTLGVSGGDGNMQTGDASAIVYVTTSLTQNLNQSPAYYGVTVDSPPEPDPNWDYYNSYTVVLDGNAFGPSGFGLVDVVSQHNSPPKVGENHVDPEPCEKCVTNTATVTANNSKGEPVHMTSPNGATATVCVIYDPSDPSTVDRLGVYKEKYWKKNPDAGPVDEITVGDVTLTKSEAIALLKKSPDKKDMTYKLAKQFIVAKFNVLIGNDDTPIAATIAAADAWFVAHPLGSGVGDKSPEWKNEGKDLEKQLKKYNGGKLGVRKA